MNRKIIIFILCIIAIFSISTIIITACTCTTGLTYVNIGDTEFHVPYCEEHDHYFAYETHTFDEQSNNTSHWQECSLCKYKLGVESHDFEFEYLTSTAHYKFCSDCGYSATEAHDMELHSDGTKHWQECEGCGYTKDEENHTFIEQYDTSKHWQECEECGYSKEIESHTFEWQSSTFYHWRECTECGYTTAQELHTLDDNGGCTVCSKSNIIMKFPPIDESVPVAK